MQKKLVIFDLDGTIINTIQDLNAGINYALRNNGFEEKSVEHTAKAIGNGISKTIWRSLPEGTSEEEHLKCFNDFRSYYKEHYLDFSVPYNGMIDTLLLLKERGYYLAVATNKLHEIAVKLVNHLYPNVFDIIQGENTRFSPKPNPEMINYVINELGVEKENVTYVGDSEVDILSAETAHIRLILVNYGFHRGDEFFQNKSVPHIDTPSELLDLLA